MRVQSGELYRSFKHANLVKPDKKLGQRGVCSKNGSTADWAPERDIEQHGVTERRRPVCFRQKETTMVAGKSQIPQHNGLKTIRCTISTDGDDQDQHHNWRARIACVRGRSTNKHWRGQ